MSNSFYNALSATIPANELEKKGDLTYLAAARAIERAGYPEFSQDEPYTAMLGGAAVSVTLSGQKNWLPVMDASNTAVTVARITLTDANNTLMRCLAKAIFCTHGVGGSVFLGFDGDGPAAIKYLGVTPESDLKVATPIVSSLKSGAQYIPWGVALAVCKITDPTFHWEVEETAGLPYQTLLNGVLVTVRTTYKGKSLSLSLPVMDGSYNAIPADKVDTFQWNTAVMRCLAKCVAFNTGYGLKVYAGDEFVVPTKTKAVTVASATKAVTSEKEAPVKGGDSDAEVVADFKPKLSAFKAVGLRDKGAKAGLLSVFKKLEASSNYTSKQKIPCLEALITAVLLESKTAEDAADLVSAIGNYKGEKSIANNNALSRVVTNRLKYIPLTEDAVMDALNALNDCGLYRGEAGAIVYAKGAELRPEMLSIIAAIKEKQ